ncbi:hypothetical protein CA54_03980 [Symmachiella macrocystis]|uniref:DUF1501 domain-containing protein n=1 Tax=Symmachiella macrocystis TaxID=2527985 RepID=A0A5C6BJ83_9PLAN|nr:DUF1501 domain-containing protein [Symmachiella macrocystis]TWU11591.1 hypothetical protein CA54_03980 [Symmachiella macrocystis]
MLRIPGSGFRHCDGVSRRSFLQVGGLALGGLSLPQLLQAEEQAPGGKSHKSVIMVFLTGGPPHQDMVDLKPEAPAEYRGEFSPIHSNVPGLDVCEHLPLLSQRMDRLAVIRTLVGSEGRHAAFQCLHGHPVLNQPPGGWPCFGSAVSKLQGPLNREIPASISLQPRIGIQPWSDPGQPGFAGMKHAPYAPNATGTQDLVLDGMDMSKLNDRRALLNRMDRLRRTLDTNDAVDGMNTYYRQAFDILTSGRLATALDVEQEDPAVRQRYGRGSKEPAGYGDAGWLRNEDFIVARRLIEAGARVVTLSFGRWDWHGQPHGTNFDNARDHLPALDQALTALLDDLRDRSMEDDVSVVVWGEFGRTPLINKRGGRDHWPSVGCALLAGGGMRTGQVIGATNARAEHPIQRPVHFQEIFATLYHNLGLDVGHLTISDLTGRPQFLIDHGKYQPLPELV